MIIHMLVICTWHMNDQSSCMITVLYKINIAPLAGGNCLYNACSMALTETRVCQLFYDAYQVLSCMKMLNTMAVIQQLN